MGRGCYQQSHLNVSDGENGYVSLFQIERFGNANSVMSASHVRTVANKTAYRLKTFKKHDSASNEDEIFHIIGV